MTSYKYIYKLFMQHFMTSTMLFKHGNISMKLRSLVILYVSWRVG